MSDQFWSRSWALFTGARGIGLLLRVLIVAAPVAALLCTRLAATDTLLAVEIGAVTVAVLTAIAPDSHLGLLVVFLVGVDWWVSVDVPASPWSIGVATSLVVFHASAAAASVIPPAALWSRSMCRRWAQRCSVVALCSAGVWVGVAAADGRRVGGSQFLVAAALVLVSAAALWAAAARPGPARPSSAAGG